MVSKLEVLMETEIEEVMIQWGFVVKMKWLQ